MHSFDTIDVKRPVTAEYTRKGSPLFSMPRPHIHNSYELYYLLEGERYYFIHDQTYHVKKGMLVLIPPNVIHRTIAVDTMDHERLLINIDASLLMAYVVGFEDQNWFEGFRPERPVISLDISKQRRMSEAIFSIFHLLNEVHEVELNRVMVSLLDILLQLSDTQKNESEDLVSEQDKGSTVFTRISEVVQYINHHYGDVLSLTILAKEFHYNPSYLSRKFKESTGFNINEYMNHVRVLEAEQLLTTTRLKIVKIAEMTGFTSQTHFGRQFKHYKGMTPTAYRKAVKVR